MITVIFVRWIGRREESWIRNVLNWFPAILFAYVIPAIVTHSFDLDLSRVYLHDISRNFIIPLAILMVMGALSFRQLRIIGMRPILLFVSGSFIIAVFAPLIVFALKYTSADHYVLIMKEEYWKGLVPIVGGWIGGSTSQLVLKELVGCPEGIFLAILVLDNILVNIWTILMFQFIQRSDALNTVMNIDDEIPDFVPDEVDLSGSKWQSAAITLGLSGICLGFSMFLLTSFLWQIIVLSLVGLMLGNFVRNWNHELVLKIGGVLIVLIMAILGLKLNFYSFSLPGIVVVIAIIWLIAHYVGMFLVARWMKLNMAWVPIASMANLGGISTAPAVTAAYNEEWMPHAILLAILSMVSGTAWGMVTIALFQLV
jgi:uncharacterized membrane protein